MSAFLCLKLFAPQSYPWSSLESHRSLLAGTTIGALIWLVMVFRPKRSERSRSSILASWLYAFVAIFLSLQLAPLFFGASRHGSETWADYRSAIEMGFYNEAMVYARHQTGDHGWGERYQEGVDPLSSVLQARREIREGKFREALASLEAARTLEIDSGSYRESPGGGMEPVRDRLHSIDYLEAQCYWQLDQKDRALKLWKEASEGLPNGHLKRRAFQQWKEKSGHQK